MGEWAYVISSAAVGVTRVLAGVTLEADVLFEEESDVVFR